MNTHHFICRRNATINLLFMTLGSFDCLSTSLAHFPTFGSVPELIVRDQREDKGGLFVFVLHSSLGALGPRRSDEGQSHRLCHFDHSAGTQTEIQFQLLCVLLKLNTLQMADPYLASVIPRSRCSNVRSAVM